MSDELSGPTSNDEEPRRRRRDIEGGDSRGDRSRHGGGQQTRNGSGGARKDSRGSDGRSPRRERSRPASSGNDDRFRNQGDPRRAERSDKRADRAGRPERRPDGRRAGGGRPRRDRSENRDDSRTRANYGPKNGRPPRRNASDDRRGAASSGARRDDRGGFKRDGRDDRGASRRESPREGQPLAQSRPAPKPWPSVDADVTGKDLPGYIKSGLRTLAGPIAERIPLHLEMALRYLDIDTDVSMEHAMRCKDSVPRVGVVREIAGLAAYHHGSFETALRELRAARRLTGNHDYLPLMADCLRGLGQPAKALELLDDPAVVKLSRGDQLELLIVCAGARADLGQIDAAVVMLGQPELRAKNAVTSYPRLVSAYSDALAAAGRTEESGTWRKKLLDAGIDPAAPPVGDEEIFDVLDPDLDEPNVDESAARDTGADLTEPAGEERPGAGDDVADAAPQHQSPAGENSSHAADQTDDDAPTLFDVVDTDPGTDT